LAGDAGRFPVLSASVCDFDCVGVEDEKMTKQELIQAAKEIRDICCNAGETNTWEDCKKCPFYADPCIFIECEDGQEAYPPNLWDIERLEREE
jgi:hypothetical protein